MTVLDIAKLGQPVLRERAREVTLEELASDEIQTFIDDLVETMRDAGGAGLAAPQVHVPLRIFAVEVRENARYPYKPPLPLRVVVNPVLTARSEERYASYEGCLSVPDVRGLLERRLEVDVVYLDRDGGERRDRVRGLSAGTFQHENDHLEGILFLDRVTDTRTLSSWQEWRRFHEAAWLEDVQDVIATTSLVEL